MLFLTSAGKLFHNFGPWTENALLKSVESDLGTCSKSRVVDLVCLSWWSETYVSNEEIYAGACLEMLLYTVRQVWYWTSFGNGSQFSSLKSCSEGVMKSAFKIILAARFCSFTSLVRLAFVVLPQTTRGTRWLSGRVSDSGARGPGFETYRRRVVSLSKTLYSPKVLVNYPGSDGSVPTWLKNCWLGR